MTCYSKKILDLFYNINNSGRIIKPEAIGRAGSKMEGTVVEFSWRVKDGRIEDARFRTFGDVNAIAISSVLTTMMTGRYVEDVLNIKAEDVLEQLQDDKPNYLYLTDLALSALTNTYENYLKRMAKLGLVDSKKPNEFANQLKEDITKLENGEELAEMYDNYNLSDISIDEKADEEQYLNNVKEYEKTVDENSIEASLRRLLNSENNFFSLQSKNSETKSNGRGRPRKEKPPEEIELETNKVSRGRGRPRKERTVEELEVEANKVKRGRGRPKKEKTAEELEAETNKVIRGRGRPKKEVEQTEGINEETVPVVRGRGRPRRERTPEELEAEANKIVRRRGRPRKVNLDENVIDNTLESEENIIKMAEEVENNEPRRRGRPRKEKTPEELEAEANKVSRGRGRPKKEKTAEELEEEANKVVRGRGRPRKNSIFAVQKLESRIADEETNITDNEIDNNIAYVEDVQDNDNVISINNQEEQPILRGRGRPRKEKTPEELEAEANKVVRGRGRPKREKTAEELEAEANRVVRGRGRPRKVNVDENLTDDSSIDDKDITEVAEENNGEVYNQYNETYELNNINTETIDIDNESNNRENNSTLSNASYNNVYELDNNDLDNADNLDNNDDLAIYEQNSFVDNANREEETASLSETDLTSDNINQYINSIKNIFMSNTHKAEEETSQVKHRGRPRKVNVDENVIDDSRVDSEDIIKVAEEVENNEPRRRGRPRKEKTPEELEAEANKIVRGRGRPKKEKTAEELEIEANKVIRGRGRPRKENSEHEYSNENASEIDNGFNDKNELETVNNETNFYSVNTIESNANNKDKGDEDEKKDALSANIEESTSNKVADKPSVSSSQEEYTFTTNSFAPAQNKYGVGVRPNSSYPVRTMTIKKTTTTPNYEEHSADYVRVQNEPKNNANEVKRSNIELSAGEKAMEKLNALKTNTPNTTNEIKTENVLDDEDPKEGVPLSENIDNILSNGGSIEDALKALMED